MNSSHQDVMAISQLSSKVKKVTKLVQEISRVEPGKRAKETLGLNYRLCCVVDDDHEVYFIKDWAVLLHHVVIKDPLCQVVVNTCQDHHKQYGCGSKTLMAMIHLLSQAVHQLICKGVPLYCVIKLTREIFDDCMKYVQSIAIPIIIKDHDYHQSEGYCVYNEEDKRKEPTSVELIDHRDLATGLNEDDDFIEIPFNQTVTESLMKNRNQKHFGVEFTSGTATKETMASNHEECKPVILAMKDKDNFLVDDDDDDDDDDVSWFFHTDDYIYTSEHDESEQINSKDSFENSKFEDNFTNHSPKTQTRDKTVDNRKTVATSFPSCGTSDCYDSDFEDCISDEEITKSTDSVLSNLQKDEQVYHEEDVVDDEFDSCFSSSAESDIPEKLSSIVNKKVCSRHFNSNEHSGTGIPKQASKQENKERIKLLNSIEASMVSKKSSKNEIQHSGTGISMQASKQENKEGIKLLNSMEASMMSKKSSKNEIQHLDKLLQEICVQKPSKTCNRALNSSRHFKTFESLENNVKLNIFSSSMSTENKSPLKKVQNLDDKTPKCVLNSSRHFQSFRPEPDFGKKETKKDSTCKNFSCDPLENELIHQKIISSKSPHVCNKIKFENRRLKDNGMDKNGYTKIISNIEELGRGLGRNSTMINYAMDCFVHNQYEKVYRRFDRRLIFSTICKGPTSDVTRLSDGLILPCTNEDISLMKDCSLRGLVINGDLKHITHHKGYKQNLKGTQIRKTIEKITGKDIWISDTLSLLEMLKVDVVFVKGLTDEKLKVRLQAQKILVFDEVPYRALAIVSYVCEAIPLIYIHEAFEGNVCKDLKVAPYDLRHLFERYTNTAMCHVNFTSSSVKTLVICHPCQLGCEQMEQDFWLCVNRLANAVEDNKVLPGRGETESKCHLYLKSQLEQAYSDKPHMKNDERLFRPVILEQLSHVFRDFYKTVKNNLEASGNEEVWTNDLNSDKEKVEMNVLNEPLHQEKHTSKFFKPETNSNTSIPSVPVFDNFYCKISCWRKAVGTVIDNIQTDLLIQTGVDYCNTDTFDKFL